jgi:hypothetical protein
MLYNLPPLSPDYSGIASVFHDLGGLTVIHDASGCTGTYTGYDEPRWFGSSSPTFCSGLRDMDAIMGDDDRLLEKIERALEETRVPCITIIGSPVPMVIGFDFKGFASLVERRTGLPTFGFPATGLAYYDQGQRDAYLAIAKGFLREVPPKNPRRVNILGASALDGFDDEALDTLENFLVSAGLERGAIWGARSSLQEIADSGAAGVNWVITAAALPLARYLEERFGAPFVAGLPVGSREEERIREGLKAASKGKKPEGIFPPVKGGGPEPGTLILGEALLCSSLRACLEAEGEERAAIGTFFAQGKEFLRPGDRLFMSEEDARQALAARPFKAVIADPLIWELLPEGASPAFTALPHRAVSGRICQESRARLFGEDAYARLDPKPLLLR